MKTCIICRQQKADFNVEHVIPYAINGRLAIDTVCVRCNGLLGTKVDHHLINFFLVQMVCYELGIKGRKARPADPWTGGVISRTDPGKKIDMKRRPDGSLFIYSHPVTKFRRDENGNVVGISITVSRSDERLIPTILAKTLERNNIPREALGTGDVKYHDLGSETVDKQFYTEWSKVQLAAIKIAYEFAVSIIPEYFRDDQAIRISRILENADIFEADPELLINKGYIVPTSVTNVYMGHMKQVIGFENNNHYLHLIPFQEGIVCHVNIFNVVNLGVILSHHNGLLPFGQDYILKNDTMAKTAVTYGPSEMEEYFSSHDRF